MPTRSDDEALGPSPGTEPGCERCVSTTCDDTGRRSVSLAIGPECTFLSMRLEVRLERSRDALRLLDTLNEILGPYGMVVGRHTQGEVTLSSFFMSSCVAADRLGLALKDLREFADPVEDAVAALAHAPRPQRSCAQLEMDFDHPARKGPGA